MKKVPDKFGLIDGLMLLAGVSYSVDTSLLIVDLDEERNFHLTENATVVFWQKYFFNNKKNYISIPAYIEQYDDVLKKRFLSWVHELGELKINNKRLIDHLEIRNGLSYWWMTILAGKHYAVSNSFHNTLRLFAIEQIVNDRLPKKIIYWGDDKQIVRVVRLFCHNNAIHFTWKKARRYSKRYFVLHRLGYQLLPNLLKSIVICCHYIITRWGLRQRKRLDEVTAEITFIDYFTHFGPQVFEKTMFSSNYWTFLVDILRENKIKTNWLHHYVPQDNVKSRSMVKELIQNFNIGAQGIERHLLLDSGLDFSLIFKVLRDYSQLFFQSFRLRTIKSCFKVNNTGLDLWPLYQKYWFQSLRGVSVVLNCMMLNLLERHLKTLPYQKIGFYLQENLSWEMALIFAWKRAGHGLLIGVPHTVIRYWDLRYFYDYRTYTNNDANRLPQPDKIAVNGEWAERILLNAGYPVQNLIQIEALRFLYMVKAKIRPQRARKIGEKKRVLVCGDFNGKLTETMLQMLGDAEKKHRLGYSYTIKLHPASEKQSIEAFSCAFEFNRKPLQELFSCCDVVFTSNATAAALDAYCYGLPVIQVLAGGMLNMSPLRGFRGVKYVADSEELGRALLDSECFRESEQNTLFFLDSALTKWRQLLDTVLSTKIRIDNEQKLSDSVY